MTDTRGPGPPDADGDGSGASRRALARRRLVLEGYLAAAPLSFGLAFALTILVRPAVEVALVAAFAVLLGGNLLVPVLLFVDARETRPDAPVGRLLVAAAILPIPTLAYYFRSDPAPSPPGRFAARAGAVVAAALLGWVGFFAGELSQIVVGLAGTGTPLRGIGVLVPGAMGLVVLGLFPIAVYADAKYVRAHGSGWAPSPVLRYLGSLAFYSPLLVVLPVYVAYHLLRRRRALGRGGVASSGG